MAHEAVLALWLKAGTVTQYRFFISRVCAMCSLLLCYALSFSNKPEMKEREGEKMNEENVIKNYSAPPPRLWVKSGGRKVTSSGSLEDQRNKNTSENMPHKHTRAHALYCQVMERQRLQKTEPQLQENQLQESEKHCFFFSRTGKALNAHFCFVHTAYTESFED